MRRIISLITILVLMFLLTACGDTKKFEEENQIMNTLYTTLTLSPAFTPTTDPNNSSTNTPIKVVTTAPSNTQVNDGTNGFDNTTYYFETYHCVHRENFSTPTGRYIPSGYKYNDNIPFEISGLTENKDYLFNVEYNYLENGLYSFILPDQCYYIVIETSEEKIGHGSIHQYSQLKDSPHYMEDPRDIYICFDDNFVNVKWKENSIDKCKYIENVKYMNNEWYQKIEFSTFERKGLGSLDLLAGKYIITYNDRTQKEVEFTKDCEYDFSYDGG